MTGPPVVSIIIPVVNKLSFTRQCLDRIARNTSDKYAFEVIVVDNGSTDGTDAFFGDLSAMPCPVRYQRNPTNVGFAKGNNIGAGLSTARYLLFLNNDTLVQPGWLERMVELAEKDEHIGIVGIKQLFPYTRTIHHTGIFFTADRKPTHLYPHVDASLPHVNKQREYQAVTGSCLLIHRDLFVELGMFDEGYLNGYEDVDLCLAVRQRGQSVVCCTSAFIYHYGQISETRTDDDDQNAARFMAKWRAKIKPDQDTYFQQDHRDIERVPAEPSRQTTPRSAPHDLLYFADDLSGSSALTWVTTELVLALHAMGTPVAIKHVALPAALGRDKVATLNKLMTAQQPIGGIQIRWSHYWPQHLNLELSGRLNLELFVINYLFGSTTAQPWDYWLQCLRQNHYRKLPLSDFCRDVLLQVGVPADDCHVFRPGYSPEIDRVEPPPRQSGRSRLLTVTNSHDLERYGTKVLLDAYWKAFSSRDDVVLVIKDYGTSSGDTTLRELLRHGKSHAAVEYIGEFTSKEKLIGLYKSCDAFVSAHRGEGYGMKILDALACGLPVITTLFGGPKDFCTPSNCFPVEFDLTPVGDCMDTRSLQITNSPLWAEPRIESLVSQLQRVVADPGSARQVGEQARRDVSGRFTWDNAARQLVRFVESVDPGPGRRAEAAVAPRAEPTERSPYWLGRRVSVVIPTRNRKASLLTCLRALERQSILPQEFEVIVVDDGSTDGTGEMLESTRFPFALKYVRREHQGPGAARNEGIQRAEGEIVLFMGDDIIAETQLLEEHLLAHAEHCEPVEAVLGHIDWPPEMRRSAVMEFVCGPSTLQFAYDFIPKLKALDYRFFYTSNISLKRRFLLEAASDGVVFDPCFAYAAFEDSEYALRLEKRGLQIHYRKPALAYHDHWMDVASFKRREDAAGKMAVVFYRKHPQLDEQLQVRWIGRWSDAVDSLVAKPELNDRLRALDTDTDAFLCSLAKSLEELIGLQRTLDGDPVGLKKATDALTSLLYGVLAVIFDVERTRGKVDEWYASVEDEARIETAKRLLGCVRKLEFFSASPREIQELQGTIGWLAHDVVGDLRRRVNDLERQLGGGLLGRTGLRAVDRTLIRATRKADFFVQQQLSRHAPGGWLDQYHAVRDRLKRLLRSSPPSSP